MAVPISMMICGSGYSCRAPTASATKSLPSCAGLSMRMLSPLLIPGPTTSVSIPISFSIARFSVFVIVGTTDAMIAPSICCGVSVYISNAVLIIAAYSRSVASRLLEIRSRNTNSFPLKHPSNMFVFPISIVKIIPILLFLFAVTRTFARTLSGSALVFRLGLAVTRTFARTLSGSALVFRLGLAFARASVFHQLCSRLSTRPRCDKDIITCLFLKCTTKRL